jgi:DNA-binding beta-propeller fold protein YncE
MMHDLNLRLVRIAGCAAVSLAASSAAAGASTLVALSENNTLTVIDTKSRKATGSMKLTGATGPLVGIDVRPADGMIYGLIADGTVVTIDRAGKATMKSKLETMVPAAAARVTVDFNPVADRLRVMSSDGTNLRVNVDDGKVMTDGSHKFAETDMHKGEKPMIIGGAYTNSMKGAKETTLYDIDGSIGGLLKQAPPNDGVLGAVGKLGLAAKSIAFDIETSASGDNTAWLVADGELHSVDLATGRATSAGKIPKLPKDVRDIAVLPAL